MWHAHDGRSMLTTVGTQVPIFVDHPFSTLSEHREMETTHGTPELVWRRKKGGVVGGWTMDLQV